MNPENQRQIVLENGQALTGQIVPLTWARFLVQEDDLCLQLNEEEIRSVDGDDDLRRAVGQAPVEIGQTSYFHEVDENGGGTDWVWSLERHQGSKPKTGQTFSFGRSDRPLSKSERRELGTVVESMEYRDKWGRTLPTQVEEEGEMGWKLQVSFDVPVLPGQSVELVHKKTWPRWSRREGDHWVRRQYIRPAAGSLTTIAIRLPTGAAYSEVEPTPLWQTALNGRQSCGWRRYIGREEAFMPVVKYTMDGLPEAAS
ncbi:MAG: hypothetical protein GKR89_15830 [Candidatus Latescibacteria bacterium]|nr:hypothetical protein [Candidatus Latescibacterota bacterium]